MRFTGLAAAALLVTAALTACGGGDSTAEGEALSVFRIAYLPNEDAAHVADARASIAAELSEAIGLTVEEFITTDYAAMVEAMRLGHVEMAFFGPLSFTRAHDRAGAIPMAQFAPEGNPELSEIRSVMVVRADSGIYTLDDLEGATMAFVDPDSTTGTLLPSNVIIEHFAGRDLTLDDLQTNGRLFSTVLFSGGHAASLTAVQMGDVDVAAISSRFITAGIERGDFPEDYLRIIYATDVVPGNTLAVRPDLGDDLMEQLHDFLMAFDNEVFFYGFQGNADLRFVPSRLEDFADLIALDARLNS
ncbi:MAG: phosphate/phosphite/phosphonate ABC transporter substrate-binding protein [Promicromonosporaceae bacterium]|nr:phosphate/phosphite/phosphonate ABC transporter substrate-binding protein [Promicromonosporaceae bacterium]